MFPNVASLFRNLASHFQTGPLNWKNASYLPFLLKFSFTQENAKWF